MMGKTIAIFGGGVGGVVAAHRLRRLLPPEHRVVVVDRSPMHVFAPALTWVMLGLRRPAQVVADLRALRRRGIEVILDEVTAIDVHQRLLVMTQGELSFDYLVLSPGAEYGTGGIPGLAQAWTYYHLDGAEALRDQLAGLQEGRVVILIPSLPYKCPAAPYEGALLLDWYYRRLGRRQQVEIHIVTPEPHPLPVAGPQVGAQLAEMLTARQIIFSPNAQVQAVDQDRKVVQLANGAEVPFDLLIAVPVHSAPAVVREARLTGPSGWVEVDPHTMATSWEGVFAIGDVTYIPLAHGLPLPKAGVFAHGQAEVVARNLASHLLGRAAGWAFDGRGQCFLETGFGRASLAYGHFYAQPAPQVRVRGPSPLWHWAKRGFAWWWLRHWF
jgi:sulfide:quinone oxidoreductase